LKLVTVDYDNNQDYLRVMSVTDALSIGSFSCVHQIPASLRRAFSDRVDTVLLLVVFFAVEGRGHPGTMLRSARVAALCQFGSTGLGHDYKFHSRDRDAKSCGPMTHLDAVARTIVHISFIPCTEISS